MPVFQTQFETRARVFSNPGSRVKPVYEAKIDSNGVIDLVETGSENLYDYIQSFKDSTDINTIVKRYAAGDVDVLSKKQGVYGDFTELPNTYAEMLNIVISGENMFNNLPVEVRAKFHHSFREWMSAMDDWSSFAELMGLSSDASETASGEQPAAAGAGGADSAVQSKSTQAEPKGE